MLVQMVCFKYGNNNHHKDEKERNNNNSTLYFVPFCAVGYYFIHLVFLYLKYTITIVIADIQDAI